MYEQSGNDTTAWTLIFYDDESRPKQLSYFMSYAVGSGSAVLDTDHINTYDDDGNVELYEVKSGNVSYVFDPTYDSLNRIDSRTVQLVTSSGTLTNTVDYEFTANGTNTSLQISKYISTIGSTSTTYQYVYDANGNITHINDANGNIQCRYTYDDLGQLIREDNMAKGASYRYYYDLAGNRIKKETFDFSTAASLGDVKKTETLGYNDSTWGDRLTSWQGTTITYDEIGNPTWYSIDYLTCLLTWNGRQLTSFENMDGLRTYTYNEEGIRIAKNDRGTLHTYQVNGTQIVSETWGIHTIFYVYDEMGSIAGMRYRTSNYAEGVFDEFLFEKNLQGDVVAIYNASGTKLVSYTYDAWGKVTTTYLGVGVSTPARFNPFKYRGYYHDSDTNLYYLNGRYYDPATGRFINADVYLNANGGLQGYNMFAYCNNNPVMYTDPNGDFAIEGIIAIIIVVVAVAATANDVCQIFFRNNESEDDDVLNVSVSDDNVHIENSYKILTPWMRYGYSFYLNHFNEKTKDVIQGSTYGIQYEWELHNYAAWIGFGDSAKHLDVGKTIFSDGKAHPLIKEKKITNRINVFSDENYLYA